LPRTLWLLVAGGLALRLTWAVYLGGGIDPRLPDQHEYLQIARNLLDSGEMKFTDARFGREVRAYRMPGYPLLVAACGGKPQMVRLAQAVIDASTILAVWLTASLWLERRWALAAAGFITFSPLQVYFCGLVLSETMLLAVVVWGIWLLASRPNYLWGLSLLSVAPLVRPSALGVGIVLGLAAPILHRGHRPADGNARRLRLPAGASAVVLTAVALLPWALRNRMVLGEWVWLTTNGGLTLMDGFHPDATGASDQRFVLSPRYAAGRTIADEVERDRWYRGEALDWARLTWCEDPARLVGLTLAKTARTWSPIPLSEDYSANRLHVYVGLAYYVPVFVMGIVGAAFGGRGACGSAQPSWAAKVFLLAPALYLTAVHAGSVGSLRYRLPADPPICILAAWGAATLASWRRG